ncbi:hypothetical protein HGRIS_011612 [Hohenbuehelia grisea]|uniref:Uncharacterized protein n=1 Tax=Hohenbuehelia grisea TaxID=104357 RepID=A0ABR3JXC9_9AGAR
MPSKENLLPQMPLLDSFLARVGRVLAVRRRKDVSQEFQNTRNAVVLQGLVPALFAANGAVVPSLGVIFPKGQTTHEESQTRRIAQGTSTVADILSSGLEIVPVVGSSLKSSLELVSKLLKFIEIHSQNKEDIKDLVARLRHLELLLSVIPSSHHAQQLQNQKT